MDAIRGRLTVAIRYSLFCAACIMQMVQSAVFAQEGASDEMLICKVTLVGQERYSLCGEVHSDLYKNKPKENFVETWEAISYRLDSQNESTVEAFQRIGVAFAVSPNHIAVKLDDQPGVAKSIELLSSNDPKTRHALLLLPKGSKNATADFTNKDKGSFTDAIRDEVRKGGMVVFPVSTGRTKAAAATASCHCAGFFGSTSGCTSVTCTLSPIGEFCNSNANCKKTDLTSVCSCQKQ